MPQRHLAIVCSFTNTSKPPNTAEVSRQKGALQPGILNIVSVKESSNLVSAIISISIFSPVIFPNRVNVNIRSDSFLGVLMCQSFQR